MRTPSIGVHGTVDVLDPDGPNGTLGRWPLAENTTTADALGGGISYAFDVKLCERLLPMFPEETVLQEYTSFFVPFPRFIDCRLIERKVQQAMAGWAAANTNVRFFEVTSLCNEGQGANLSPPPPPYFMPFSPPSAPPSAPPRPSDPAPYPPSSPPAPPSSPPAGNETNPHSILASRRAGPAATPSSRSHFTIPNSQTPPLPQLRQLPPLLPMRQPLTRPP